MRITSLEIKQHEFEKSFRGYNVDEVNHFLGNIAQEWDRMLNEVKMLKMQLDIAEKEASKLREVEMTLIKTLRTAEDTSSKITENASIEAAKKIEDANQEAVKTITEANQEAARTLSSAKTEATKLVDDATLKAHQIVKEAENTNKQLVTEAETKVKDIQAAAEIEIAELDAKYNALETRKNALLGQLKSYNDDLANLLGNVDSIVTEEKPLEIKAEVKEDVKTVDFFAETQEKAVAEEIVVVEETVEEDYSSGISLPSAVNAISLETTVDDQTNLEIIEGIGPKIKEVLIQAGVKDFRTLATTPEYRLKDILAAAGSHFATHDPSTWNEQALLAANGNWEKLEALKSRLIAGREPKEEITDTTAVTQPNTDGANTEEMLDKVNKVKAAIRKAMIEKSETQQPQAEANPKSGSFFDSI